MCFCGTENSIRDLVKSIRIKIHKYWIKSLIGDAYNKHAKALAKEFENHQTLDVYISLTFRQVKENFFGEALVNYQNKWDQSEDVRVTYAIFQNASTR